MRSAGARTTYMSAVRTAVSPPSKLPSASAHAYRLPVRGLSTMLRHVPLLGSFLVPVQDLLGTAPPLQHLSKVSHTIDNGLTHALPYKSEESSCRCQFSFLTILPSSECQPPISRPEQEPTLERQSASESLHSVDHPRSRHMSEYWLSTYARKRLPPSRQLTFWYGAGPGLCADHVPMTLLNTSPKTFLPPGAPLQLGTGLCFAPTISEGESKSTETLCAGVTKTWQRQACFAAFQVA